MKKRINKLAIGSFILGAMLMASMAPRAFADNDKGGFGDHDGGLQSTHNQPSEFERTVPPEAWAFAHPYANGNGNSDYGRSHHDSNNLGATNPTPSPVEELYADIFNLEDQIENYEAQIKELQAAIDQENAKADPDSAFLAHLDQDIINLEEQVANNEAQIKELQAAIDQNDHFVIVWQH